MTTQRKGAQIVVGPGTLSVGGTPVGETEPMAVYVEPWRRQSVSLGGSAPAPSNAHLTQLQPRRDRRNPRLDERIAEARRKAAQHRVSGHSLIR